MIHAHSENGHGNAILAAVVITQMVFNGPKSRRTNTSLQTNPSFGTALAVAEKTGTISSSFAY